MRYWTVVLEAKIDNSYYGIMPVCVEAETQAEAERIAIEQQSDQDYLSEVKVSFTLK